MKQFKIALAMALLELATKSIGTETKILEFRPGSTEHLPVPVTDYAIKPSKEAQRNRKREQKRQQISMKGRK